MSSSLRLAVRDWDYITPLALGDVQSDKISLHISRVPTLPDLLSSEQYDAAEISFSRYAQYRANGGEDLIAIPHFLMRAFRHRCIITNKDSQLESIASLTGMRIGLTGWQDSGNTWTRAILRNEGINVHDVSWFVGRLTREHPVADRLNGFGVPGRIMSLPNDEPLIDALRAGRLDAVMTPFMPKGFYDENSGLRQLLPQCRMEEVRYYNKLSYVPGIHLLAFKADYLNSNPWIGEHVSKLLDSSSAMWTDKRRKYVDTTPWIIDELRQTACDLRDDWSKNGYQHNEKMIKDFLVELFAQGIINKEIAPHELFLGTSLNT